MKECCSLNYPTETPVYAETVHNMHHVQMLTGRIEMRPAIEGAAKSLTLIKVAADAVIDSGDFQWIPEEIKELEAAPEEENS